MSFHDMLILRNGGRREFWLTHLGVVASFIKENALKPVDAKHLGIGSPGLSLEAVAGVAGPYAGTPTTQTLLLWDPRHGGWPMPHLHYAGEMYALTESQWEQFSKNAMAGFADKLRKTERVTFNQLMEVSGACAEL
jgi:hypothetical protein